MWPVRLINKIVGIATAVTIGTTSFAVQANAASGPPHVSSVAPTSHVQATPAGPTLKLGSTNALVTSLEQFLDNSKRSDFYAWTAGGYDNDFGPTVLAGLKHWQAVTHHPVTGTIVVGSSQWQQLKGEATQSRLPKGISKTAVVLAKSTGWAIDSNLSAERTWVLHYQASTHQVLVTLSIASSHAGVIKGKKYTTYQGVFHIFRKEGPGYRAHTTEDWNNAPMPWATFFDGGQAFHEDPLTPSHGCIHIPSMAAAKYIHDLPNRTPVVINT
jgi:hypothetical protein